MTPGAVPGRTARALVCFVALAALACSERRSAPNATVQPSPNASILPAPLASAADLSGPPALASASAPADSTGRDPEPPPEPAPLDRPLPEDGPAARDATSITIVGSFRWADVPPVPIGIETSAVAVKEATSRLELAVAVDLFAAGRMRFALDSPGFPLPEHTEVRARSSYYGHVLVWPEHKAYSVLPAGSLRALFAERRADVAPLLRAVVRPGGSGSVLGHRTVLTELETSLGVLSLEQAALPATGGAGELLCRLLVELVGMDPSNDACRPERVPLYAHYRWNGGGSFAFVATAIDDRRETLPSASQVPPAGARWAPGELPPAAPLLFTAEELARFKLRAVHIGPPPPRAPAEGITAANETNLLEYLLLDGVAVARIPPRSRVHVSGPIAGKYQVAWRDFFGTAVTPPTAIDIPGFVRIGTPEADAGTKY
jgi:hypothetical protein